MKINYCLKFGFTCENCDNDVLIKKSQAKTCPFCDKKLNLRRIINNDYSWQFDFETVMKLMLKHKPLIDVKAILPEVYSIVKCSKNMYQVEMLMIE